MKMIMRIARTKKPPRLYPLNDLNPNHVIFLTCSCWKSSLVTSLKTKNGDAVRYKSTFNYAEGFTNMYELLPLT